jgi:hypothetical protein
MDPYLEDPAVWSDFHGSFLLSIRAELNTRLPEGYVARWDRYVWVDEPEDDETVTLVRPDVFVTRAHDQSNDEASVVLAAPTMAILPQFEPKGKGFLKIVDAKGKRVVTVVEMLSPTNKAPGKDRNAYLEKRQEYFRTGTNLVEIDFLRGGVRPPIEGKRAPADYYILVSAAVDFPRAGIWPLTIRDPLPPIPVPLDPGVEPVVVPLQPCFERCYHEARFWEDIDYNLAPEPPLGEVDAIWSQQRIAEHTK